MNKSILVTGATGRSGHYFLKELESNYKQLEFDFRFIVRSTSNTRTLDNSNFPIKKYIGDLDDEKFLFEALEGVDTVLHIAGIYWSKAIVKASIQNNVNNIILVHTTGIYSKYKKASQDYIRIEDEIHELINGSAINLTILRPTMIYGSLDDNNISVFIRMVDKLRVFPIVSNGMFELQPVHQKDLGKAYYQVLTNQQITKNRNYILSGSEAIYLIEILRTISKVLKKKTVFISIPFFVAHTGSVMVYLLSLKRIDYREKVQRLVEPRMFSHDDATNDFGYNPICFLEGLKEEIEEHIMKFNTK